MGWKKNVNKTVNDVFPRKIFFWSFNTLNSLFCSDPFVFIADFLYGIMVKHYISLLVTLFLRLPARTYAEKEIAESYFPSLDVAEKLEYQSWLDSRFAYYSGHTFLPSDANKDTGAAVFWSINGDDITFAIAVRASGWVGFGISEAGGMNGADVVLFRASQKTLVDSYTLDSYNPPLTDDCQDWNLLSEVTNGGWIIIEIKRKLDTGDSQDHPIVNDKELWIAPTRLIAAWGNTDFIGYHGLNRARISVRIFSESTTNNNVQILESTLSEGGDGFFDVREDDHLIEAKETTYAYVCRTFSDIKQELGLTQDSITAIGTVPVVDEDTSQFVHHFTVYLKQDCSGTNQLQRSMVFGWAPGGEGMMMPEDVGFPLFDTVYRQAIEIEIHYNNPSLVSGKRDSSGVRLFYSLEERTHKAGVLELGDPFVVMRGEDISNGLSEYEFSCPGSCSSLFLDSGVTVLHECK